jgi:hypothetical protein
MSERHGVVARARHQRRQGVRPGIPTNEDPTRDQLGRHQVSAHQNDRRLARRLERLGPRRGQGPHQPGKARGARLFSFAPVGGKPPIQIRVEEDLDGRGQPSRGSCRGRDTRRGGRGGVGLRASGGGGAPRPATATRNVTPVVAFLRALQLDMVGPR